MTLNFLESSIFWNICNKLLEGKAKEEKFLQYIYVSKRGKKYAARIWRSITYTVTVKAYSMYSN